MDLFILTGLFLACSVLFILYLVRRNKITLTEKSEFVSQIQRLKDEKEVLLEKNRSLDLSFQRLEDRMEADMAGFEAKIKSMDRYKQMVEDTEEFLFEVNYKGQFVYANPIMLERLGYSPNELQSISYLDIAKPEQLKELIQFYSRQYHKKQIDSYGEWEAINRFGESVWVGLRVRMAFDPLGRISSVKGIARDLSVQKAVEHVDQIGKGVFQSTFQHFVFPVLVFGNKDQNDVSNAPLLWANQATLKLMDLDWYEVAGISMNDISTILAGCVKEALESPEKMVTWSTKKRPDVVFRVLCTLSKDWIWLLLSDVTDFSSTVKKGSEEYRFLKTILDTSAVDIAVFSPLQEYLYINRSAVKDQNIREWMIGKTDEEYVKLRNSNVRKALYRIMKFNEVKISHQSSVFEEFMVDFQSNIMQFSRELTPVLNVDGELEYVVLTGINQTEKYLDLEEKLEAEDRLRFASKLQISNLTGSPNDDKSQFKTEIISILERKTFGLTPGGEYQFNQFPVTLELFSNQVKAFAAKIPNVNLNLSVYPHNKEIYRIPRILIFEILNVFNRMTFPDQILVSVSTDSTDEGQLSISIVADVSKFHGVDETERNAIVAKLCELVHSEGFTTTETNGFLLLSFPLTQASEFSISNFPEALRILKGKSVLVGPKAQKSTIWLSDELEKYAAEVILLKDLPSLYQEVSLAKPNDMVVWWGLTPDEMKIFSPEIFRNEKLKFLCYSAQNEILFSKSDPDVFILKPLPMNAMEVVEDVWYFAKSRNLKPIPSVDSEQIARVNFDKLVEITDGDSLFMTSLIKSYLSSLNECKSEFEKHLKTQDSNGLKFLLHKIRATINTFEINQLDKVLRESISVIDEGKQLSEKKKRSMLKKITLICESVESQIRVYAEGKSLELKGSNQVSSQ